MARTSSRTTTTSAVLLVGHSEDPVEILVAPSTRFVVTDDNRVYDTQQQRNVDGPFRDRDVAEARARKREIRG